MFGVVMTARYADESVQALLGRVPAALVTVNGKPILEMILSSFSAWGVEEVFVAVGDGKELVEQWLRSNAPASLRVRCVPVDSSLGVADAVVACLSLVPPGPVVINLGDTVCSFDESPLKDESFIAVAPRVVDHSRWCIVHYGPDGRVTGFTERARPPEPAAELLGTATGVYYIAAADRSRVTPSPRSPELSSVLAGLVDAGALCAKAVREWGDFGHLDRYQESKKRMLQARAFNSLRFDDFRGTVTKTSSHSDKFSAEIRWYENLPPKLRVFAPRVINSGDGSGGSPPFIELEYYAYPTLAELFVYGGARLGTVESALRKVFLLIEQFRAERAEVAFESFRAAYVQKTRVRVDEARRSNGELDRLLGLDQLYLNGDLIPGWPSYASGLERLAERFYRPEDCSLVHGDLCLSNVLYEPATGIMRLIDPRGEWGGVPMVGDIKYDVAKLRHSVVGRYDFIVAGYSSAASVGSDAYALSVASPPEVEATAGVLDTWISARFNLNEIKLIEGLLFISMLPLHSDAPRRQLAFALSGLSRLSEVRD